MKQVVIAVIMAIGLSFLYCAENERLLFLTYPSIQRPEDILTIDEDRLCCNQQEYARFNNNRCGYLSRKLCNGDIFCFGKSYSKLYAWVLAVGFTTIGVTAYYGIQALNNLAPQDDDDSVGNETLGLFLNN